MLRSLVLCFAFVAPVAAQGIAAVHVRIDNDFFALRIGQPLMDFDYTSGLEVGVEIDRTPPWAVRILPYEAEQVTTRFHIGQEIYTPRSRGGRIIPGERPFAGWLYGAASLHAESATTFQDLRLEVGVVGPPALAEETQNGLHELFGFEELVGWENQLPTEPGIVATYDVGRRIRLSREGNSRVEFRPAVGIGLGTKWSGMTGRVQLIADHRALSLFAGFQGEWVWRNEILDGTAFRESLSTPKIPVVAQIDYGASLRLGQFEVTARFVARSREYDGQPNSHQYGSLAASYYF